MQLVNISFRTLLIYWFLFYLLKSVYLFCRVSHSLNFSFSPVMAFNMLLCPLQSLIKFKFNFLTLISGVVFFHQKASNDWPVVSLLFVFPPIRPSFLSISHLPDSWQGSQRLDVWSEELPPPGLLPRLIPLLPVYAVNMAFYSFEGHHGASRSLPRVG